MIELNSTLVVDLMASKQNKNKDGKIHKNTTENNGWMLKTILEASKDSMFLLNNKGIILETNEATARRFGIKPGEMIGRSIKDFISSDLFESRWQHIENVFKTAKPAEFEDKRDGMYFHHYLSPVLDGGKLNKLVVFSQDVTKQKIAEIKLKKAHNQLEATLKAIPDLMFEVDDDGRILDYHTPESSNLDDMIRDFVGETVCNILPQDSDKLLKAIKEASIQGWHKGTTYSLDSPTGKLWYEISIAKKEDNSDGETHYIALARDITERKKNEETLKQALNYNRSLIDASLDPLVTIGSDGKITDVNDAVEFVTGYNRIEIIGTEFSDYFTEPIKAKEGYQEVFRTGSVRDYYLNIQHRDGHVTPVLYNASVYHDENGEVVGVFAAARDITALKKAEKEIKKQIILTNSINKVLKDALNVETDDEVALICLKVAENLTKSKFGLIMEINDQGTVDTTAVSDPGWSECQIPQSEAKKLLSDMDISSYWGRVIREGISQIVNNPEFDPDAGGVPEGHPKINSFLGIPLKRGDETIGLIGLANKESGYDHEDMVQVETLAVSFMEALYNKRAEEQIGESLKEKEMLLKEIHHRVKNNLAVISSLLSLQSNYIKDKDDLELFRESQTRAKSMALIHERLYQSEDLKRIDFSDYIKTLSSDLFMTYAGDPDRIKLNMDLEHVLVDINSAIPLGLILNELISNSMKYAFPNGENGDINIKLESKEGEFILIVGDTGVGLPEGLDFKNTGSLGLQLVTSLTDQIDGNIELDQSKGTQFTIKFKESY